jgi:predicted transcriptional regulator
MLKIHKIQIYILRCLAETDSAKFSELLPAGVASSLFAYHLKTLLTDGIIKKARMRYNLTEKGAKYLEGISVFDNSIKIKTSVLVENDKGQSKLVSGELEPSDERIASASKRITQKKLSQKKLSKIQHIGDAYIKLVDKNGRLQNNSLHHIFYAKTRHDLTDVDSDLPEQVVQEILFVKNGADGHFFFERSYIV